MAGRGYVAAELGLLSAADYERAGADGPAKRKKKKKKGGAPKFELPAHATMPAEAPRQRERTQLTWAAFVDQALLRVQHRLQGHTANPEFLAMIQPFFPPIKFEEVVEERCAGLHCGWAVCQNTIKDFDLEKKTFRISLAQQRVYETTTLKLFCNPECHKKACEYKARLPTHNIYVEYKPTALTLLQLFPQLSVDDLAEINPAIHAGTLKTAINFAVGGRRKPGLPIGITIATEEITPMKQHRPKEKEAKEAQTAAAAAPNPSADPDAAAKTAGGDENRSPKAGKTVRFADDLTSGGSARVQAPDGASGGRKSNLSVPTVPDATGGGGGAQKQQEASPRSAGDEPDRSAPEPATDAPGATFGSDAPGATLASDPPEATLGSDASSAVAPRRPSNRRTPLRAASVGHQEKVAPQVQASETDLWREFERAKAALSQQREGSDADVDDYGEETEEESEEKEEASTTCDDEDSSEELPALFSKLPVFCQAHESLEAWVTDETKRRLNDPNISVTAVSVSQAEEVPEEGDEHMMGVNAGDEYDAVSRKTIAVAQLEAVTADVVAILSIPAPDVPRDIFVTWLNQVYDTLQPSPAVPTVPSVSRRAAVVIALVLARRYRYPLLVPAVDSFFHAISLCESSVNELCQLLS
ncbi:putative RNA polymerase II subunit B1 CTD phosphatase RPAP2-like protein [Diplonema papillatum]|nr:putative RNA polymerase II subunit B1 CTD phosphatase RPAP2-like protein [Diplonema papillatum]